LNMEYADAEILNPA